MVGTEPLCSSPLTGTPILGEAKAPSPPCFLVIDSTDLPEEIREGTKEVHRHALAERFFLGSTPTTVTTSTDRVPPATAVIWTIMFESKLDLEPGQLRTNFIPNDPNLYAGSGAIRIEYNRPIEAFRALGRVLTEFYHLSNPPTPKEWFIFEELAQFETLGTMLDCSRNGVFLLDRVFEWLRYCALLGINMVQLYTEDTYQIRDEPFFGYLRGPYTAAELTAIDEYAFHLGVEVVPCIQTLGHLGQILQWPRFANVRDTSEVLLSRFDETYALIEKMIRSVTGPLRSRRIHIGMDEAYGVGEGRFRQLYGSKDGTEIFIDHLERVTEICRAVGVKPMIWSDMLFCLAAKNNALYAYYDQSNTALSPDAMSRLPADVELVFWNYYHVNPDIYAKKLQQHRELGCVQPWMASGAWTWNRFWCSLPFTLESNQASIVVSKHPADGVRHFMLTVWGDEGNECDFWSALPALVFVAHHGYTPAMTVDQGLVRRSFAALCGGSYDDWIYASRLDEAPARDSRVETRMQLPPNLSKWLLWEDPFLSFMSPQYAGYDLEEHYRALSNYLFHCAAAAAPASLGDAAATAPSPSDGRAPRHPLNLRLQLPARLAQVLALKCHLRERLVYAYRNGNLFQLYELTVHRLDPLIRHARMLWQYHRALWMYMYKPYGWEVVELRYGGLLTRLQTMRDRIMNYIHCQSSRLSAAAATPRDEASGGTELAGHPGQGNIEDTDMAVAGATAPPSPAPQANPDEAAGGNSTGGGGHHQPTTPHPLAFGLRDPLNLESSGFPLPNAETIPEFEEDLQCVYEHAGTMLLLDYGRVATPSRLG
ncbi:hypothetical protein IWQ60_005607 [Tieghemiomyces parasiticus]|uniref:beta-N-acetylhexosaminidase n=1 Tax=Tieghemiomyces parasiticus TaxID=78921 RepID=A0A9W8DY29_9FUNG|nr:hypothetical protein IWQ60_005607 [Tieghemiomyces parasiticus]